jgi:hypothetical protein
MEENTAIKIAREWLRNAGASEERLWDVTGALERIAAEPDVYALAVDGRLVMLAKKGLWVGTLEAEAVNRGHDRARRPRRPPSSSFVHRVA